MRKVEEIGRPFKSNLLKGTKAGKWRTVIGISIACVFGISQAYVIYWGYQKSQKEKKTDLWTSLNNLHIENRMTERYIELQSRKAQLEQKGMSVGQPLNDKSS